MMLAVRDLILTYRFNVKQSIELPRVPNTPCPAVAPEVR